MIVIKWDTNSSIRQLSPSSERFPSSNTKAPLDIKCFRFHMLNDLIIKKFNGKHGARFALAEEQMCAVWQAKGYHMQAAQMFLTNHNQWEGKRLAGN